MSHLKWYQHILIFSPLITLIFELAAFISSIITIYRFYHEIVLFQEYHIITIPAILFIILISRFLQFFIQHEIFIRPSSGITVIFVILTALNMLIIFNQIMMLEKIAEQVRLNNYHKPFLVNQSMKEFYKDENIKFLWNSIQTKHSCCGYNNYTDWKYFAPQSCFKSEIIPKSKSPSISAYHQNREGCGRIVNEKMGHILVESEKMLWNLLNYEIIMFLGIVTIWSVAFLKFLYTKLCFSSPQIVRRNVVLTREAHDLPPPYDQYM